jgi:PEP-CTERM motif
MIRKAALTIALAGCSLGAHAAVDNFDGYTGSLFGQSGGSTTGSIAWTGGWSDQGFGSSGNLISSNLGSVNGFGSSAPYVEYPLNNSQGGANALESTRTFTAQSSNNAVVYVYSLVSVGNGNGPVNTTGSFGGLGIFSGTNELFLIGERFQQPTWGLQVNNLTLNGMSGDSAVSLGNFTTTLLLAKIDQAANTISLFVNPDFSQTEASNTAAVSLNYGTLPDSFDTVRLRAGNANTGNVWQFDNVNVTNISPFAVPEPSTLALLTGPALLGAWFSIRRRRVSQRRPNL